MTRSPKPIKGAGLTNPGIVVLQFLLILMVETAEYSISKVGLLTGIAIWVAVFGGIYLGRSGTSFASAVNPPIAFFLSTIIIVGTAGGLGMHLTKFGLDMVIALGGGAPYLAMGTIAAWGWHFYASRTLNSGTGIDRSVNDVSEREGESAIGEIISPQP
jgi:hypothetical protein